MVKTQFLSCGGCCCWCCQIAALTDTGTRTLLQLPSPLRYGNKIANSKSFLFILLFDDTHTYSSERSLILFNFIFCKLQRRLRVRVSQSQRLRVCERALSLCRSRCLPRSQKLIVVVVLLVPCFFSSYFGFCFCRGF